MRFVIVGAGAVGGVIGARLHQSGREVVLVARGAHYDAIARDGLRLDTPGGTVTLSIPVTAAPGAVEFGSGDVVLVATKSQDTAAVAQALSGAAPVATPVMCLQNGIENERLLLRYFPNVYAALVLAPASHLEPGVVCAHSTGPAAVIDLGRYPDGIDEMATAVAAALEAAGISSRPRADAARLKQAKLVSNLTNAVETVCGPGADARVLADAARAEGRAVLRAARPGFSTDSEEALRGRWSWPVGEVNGRARGGGSTWQSVTRRAGSAETDYLNGEIVLLGRLAGLPTPVNALLAELVRRTVREGRDPGWCSAADVLARLPAPLPE